MKLSAHFRFIFLKIVYDGNDAQLVCKLLLEKISVDLMRISGSL